MSTLSAQWPALAICLWLSACGSPGRVPEVHLRQPEGLWIRQTQSDRFQGDAGSAGVKGDLVCTPLAMIVGGSPLQFLCERILVLNHTGHPLAYRAAEALIHRLRELPSVTRID